MTIPKKRWIRLLLCFALCLSGCKIDFSRDTDKPVDPEKPSVRPAPIERFDRAACSEALARLAERCAKSEARRATVELDGTLSELQADGVEYDYLQRVRVAVPSIGAKPARDLDASEIEKLRSVR